MMLTSTAKQIFVVWERPQFLPRHYIVEASCVYKLNRQHTYTASDRSIAAHAVGKPLKVHPYSDCTVKLLAIYNPATIDEGLVDSTTTRIAGKINGVCFNFSDINVY